MTAQSRLAFLEEVAEPALRAELQRTTSAEARLRLERLLKRLTPGK